MLNHILCGRRLVKHYFEWLGVGGGGCMWHYFCWLGWVEGGGALFWVVGHGLEKILGG